MRIDITSYSSAISDCLANPGPLGTVHSVFDRALNILVSESSRILALTFPGAGGLPYAFMIPDGSIDNFPSCGITPGQAVDLQPDSSLEIKDAGVSFHFASASTWNPAMGSLDDPENIDAFLDLLTWSTRYVFEKANRAGLVPLLNEPQHLFEGTAININDPEQRIASLAAPYVIDLLDALQKGDRENLALTTARLLGYGIGGTPSGDDLLVGLLAALQRSSSPRANRMKDQLTDAILRQLGADVTSLLSLTVLRHAMAGEYSEKIHEVTRQLLHPTDDYALKASLDRLLLHGATSGSEMLLGICLGFMLAFETRKGV